MRPFPRASSTEIEALPEVEAAAGGILDLQSNSNPAQLVGADGKKIGGAGGAPTFGVGLDSSELRFSPLSLAEGDMGARRRPGRHRREHRERQRLRGRRHDRRGRARAGEAVRDHRHREVRLASTRSAARRSPSSTFRRRRPSSRRRGTSTRSRSRRRTGVTPEELVQALEPLVPSTAEVQTGSEQAAADAERHERGHRDHHVHPPRVRRHRALRRRLRHLQHAVDHRRAAHARVRHAADARRLPPPGARVGRRSRAS